MPGRIQTLEGDIAPADAGPTLVHEHVWASFSGPSGDPDLEITCEAEAVRDLADARSIGVRTIVEVTTVDMRADVERTAGIARQADVRAVKSTGWFRSPFLDRVVRTVPTDTLAQRLVDDLTVGFPGSQRRAGCVGELGLAETQPTLHEARVLDASAAAALATGAGIVLHTDHADNGRALVTALLARDVPPGRLLVGHARVADPLAWHVELAQQGSTIGFDQLGHPRRDTVSQVAARILELLAHVRDARIAVSADVGRRSRLRAFGGSGYAAGPAALLARLREAGLPEPLLAGIRGAAAAAFLALPDEARDA